MTAADQPVVFDCEALSRAVRGDGYLRAVVENARDTRRAVVVPVVTLVEATHPRIDQAAMAWVLSRLTVEPDSEPIARSASALLVAAGLHGHRHALDALVVATALAVARGATPIIYTSDPDDLQALSAGRAAVVPLR